MKIIVSPSKSQSNLVKQLGLSHPTFYTDTKKLVRLIKSLSKDEFAQMMHLKGSLLDDSYQVYKHFKMNCEALTPALSLYTGVVYERLKLDQYNELELNYLNDHIRIISALYGVLSPMDGVQAYRLDFTMKLNENSLTQFWKKKLVKYFKNEALILDCASLEFSHLLSPLKEKVHRIEFIDCIDGQEKIISYNAKKLRGLMAHYCIKHQVDQIEQIQEFNEEGYQYQSHRSDASKSVFIHFSSSIQG